jgi:hypothetical protein
LVRVKRSGREQIGQTGWSRFCSPTGRIKSRSANMLDLRHFAHCLSGIGVSNARLKFKRMFEPESRNFDDISDL